MDLIGVSGLVVSVAGFALSLWQIGKARTAAEAAKAAAQEAIAAMSMVYSVANIQEIYGRSRDLLHLARANNLDAAATAAFELRDQVARFQATDAGRRLTDAQTWQQIFVDLRSIHDRFESAAMLKILGGDECETLLHRISELHIQLSVLAAMTADSGVNYGDS